MEEQIIKLIEGVVHQITRNSDTAVNNYCKVDSSKFSDYQCGGIRQLHDSLGLDEDLGSFIAKLVDSLLNIHSDKIREVNYKNSWLNIKLTDKFLLDAVNLLSDTFNTFNALVATNVAQSPRSHIIVDYSSPNIAKSLHIGHLRSTIIGESIVRLLQMSGNEVEGHNHVGDWGTQFGMIINYLKKPNEPPIDEKTECSSGSSGSSERQIDEIMQQLKTITSLELTEIYREAKKRFDHKVNYPKFADESRHQTFLLQSGDQVCRMIWERLCEISAIEYNSIYATLGIQNLITRGESFYHDHIPKILEILRDSKLLQLSDGAQIVMLENWTQPLIIVKSDGAYTYDTTDLAALYHRLCVMNVDQIIYVTDLGQKPHFELCFEVAKLLGWTTSNTTSKIIASKKLVHIGFGFVCDEKGRKLKSRSGDVILLRDHINDVIEESRKVMSAKLSESATSEDNLNETAIKIGINTLKYYDFNHQYSVNYRYDPSAMFRFNGDSGVYTMYCYARLQSIIESTTSIANIQEIRHTPYTTTDETRKLLITLLNVEQVLTEAVMTLELNIIVKYLYRLCVDTTKFLGQKGGKIVGTVNEENGIAICQLVKKVIDKLYWILNLAPVAHI